MKKKKRIPFVAYPAIGLATCFIAIIIIAIITVVVPHEFLPELFTNIGNGKTHIIPIISFVGILFALATYIGLFVSELEGYDVMEGKWRSSRFGTCSGCGSETSHTINRETMKYSCNNCRHKS